MRRCTPETTDAMKGSPKNRVVSSGTTNAIALVWRLASERAAWLGTYFRSRMARLTDSSAVGLTDVEPFTTRETVDRETPASAATCSIVAVVVDDATPSSPHTFCERLSALRCT